MDMQVAPGKYVAAVSGGVDSMALLDLLVHQGGLELVVAHFDHGIRDDSDEDRQLVEQAAKKYGLAFVTARGNLGSQTSEAAARVARYAFLRRVQKEQGARAIITAHHQDDALETAIINMLRGTGPRGLSSLRSTDGIIRPLLNIPKRELIVYARQHSLAWREDSTNQDERYLRNYIRRQVVPRMSDRQRVALLQHIAIGARLDDDIGQLLASHIAADELPRAWFIHLPYDVSCEVLAAWLRRHRISFDRPTIHRLVVFAKTAGAGKQADIQGGWRLRAVRMTLALQKPEHQVTASGAGTV